MPSECFNIPSTCLAVVLLLYSGELYLIGPRSPCDGLTTITAKPPKLWPRGSGFGEKEDYSSKALNYTRAFAKLYRRPLKGGAQSGMKPVP